MGQEMEGEHYVGQEMVGERPVKISLLMRAEDEGPTWTNQV